MARRDTTTAKETTIREGGAETVTDKVKPAERPDEVLVDKLEAGVQDDALRTRIDQAGEFPADTLKTAVSQDALRAGLGDDVLRSPRTLVDPAEPLKTTLSVDALRAGLGDDAFPVDHTFSPPSASATFTRPDPLAPLLAAKVSDLPAAGYILIVSRTAGFRRCGVVHPLRALYPLDYFTEYQLRHLQAEPELEVMTVGTPIPAATPIAGVGLPFIGKLTELLRT